MKRIMPFLFPVINGLLFYVFFFIVAFLINFYYPSSDGGYGGLGLALMLIGLWPLVMLPIGAAIYGKMIRNHKFRILFCLYHSLITAFIYIFPFSKEDETYAIGLILFLYNLFLSVCFSMKLDKKPDESIEDNQDKQIEE